MKTQRKMGIPLRPLLLTTVVGVVCQQYAIAQTTPTPPPAATTDERTSPFLPRPPQFNSYSVKAGATGVRPNVMFFIDDSGSMQQGINYVPGRRYKNWALNRDCSWSVQYNRTHRDKCFYIFYDVNNRGNISGSESNGARPRRYVTFSADTRMQVAIDGMHAILDSYDGKVNWSLYSLWGTEKRHLMGGKPDWGRWFDTEEWQIPGIWSYWDNRYKTYAIPAPVDFVGTAAEMRDYVNSLSPYLDTPTTDRYIRAIRVIRDNIKYRCQKNYIVVLSDGDANTDEIPGYPYEERYTNETGFLDWEKKYYGTFKRWGIDKNAQSEGPWYRFSLPGSREEYWYHPYYGRTRYNGEGWNGIGLFSHTLRDKDLIPSGGRPDKANDSKDAEGGDWDDPKFPKQLITTYAVGFGNDLSADGITYLRGAASCPNCYYQTNDGNRLKEIFGEILNEIAKETKTPSVRTRGTSTPSVSGSSIASIAASLSLDTDKWASVMLFNFFDDKGTAIDEAIKPKPAKYDDRVVLVNNGKTDGSGIYWLTATDTARRVDFALTSEQEFRDAFVPWILRDPGKTDKQIQDAANNITPRRISTYRVRTDTAGDVYRQMGDVLGTPTIALGKDVAGKQKYVITAANDGMTYIFESTAGTSAGTPYALKLNYLPAGMQRESSDDSLTVGKTLPLIAEDGYGKENILKPHLYLNNGGISWLLTAKTRGFKQQYVMMGNMGQGGRGAYALSIAGEKRDGAGSTGMEAGGQTQWQTSVPMWETEKGVNNGLGYTVSSPTIAQVATQWDAGSKKPKLETGVRVYAFLANGYRPGVYDDAGNFTPNLGVNAYDRTPTLYVYEMMGQEFGLNARAGSLTEGDRPGTLVKKIPVPPGPDVGPGALSTPLLVDSDINGVVDVAYAGDQFGNLYRFDLRGEPSTWKAVMIYKGDKKQPITAAPAVYRNSEKNYVVVFGTGSDVFKHDLKDTNQQMIAGIYDDLSIDTPAVLTNDSLFTQTFTESDKKRYIVDAGFDKNVHKGWKVLLKASSTDGDYLVSAEKAVSQPGMLLSTAFISTRIYRVKEVETKLPPQANPRMTCYESESSVDTKGTSWTMAINAFTGAGPDIKRGGYFTDKGGNAQNHAGKDEGYITSAVNIIDTAKVEPNARQLGVNGNLGQGEAESLENPGQNLGRNDCLAKTSKWGNLRAIQEDDPSTGGGTTPTEGAGRVDVQPLGGKRCGDPSFIRGIKREILL
ncbi:Tfp pilus assembly protein, tip-associated adhesin PilY1 [Cardiobacterium valvarum]|uniref:Tfp pilus assembly protein, tip-associated adhesin PilY1 n=2 Tax=Cardiobacterium valvarum TaxID=194702 RepID=A0A381DZI6_9GAMM|nr:Tfp pilus assembly protein, tip-associated adhesin PilY1 [Cardiobacterium valvarum]